ncbi:vitamin B6 transporter Tpn1p [Trichomonascus vanleenenianus]|uniref:Tpn1p n=1 Tax=Trichomonascus vanleenenianus TaxID=2268995 RepID=UPI003ECADC01
MKQDVENMASKEHMRVQDASSESLLEPHQKNDWFSKFIRFSEKVDSFGVELRGIHRAMPYERHDGGSKKMWEMVLLWMSGAGGLSTISGFFLGPLIFGLSFNDCISAGTAGTIVGTFVAAYGATMGPRSGLRQMVGARFQFGWWTAKICAFFNVLTLLGWSVVNCVFGGQILASLSNGKVPLEIGIVIITVISFCISIFGIRYVQFFESFAAIPVILTFMLLYVCAGKHFDIHSPSVGSDKDIQANWLTFFSSSFGITGTWIALTSDYYVDFPEDFPAYKTLFLTWGAILVPTMFVGILGIGLGTAAVAIPSWAEAFNTLGNGGLLDAAFRAWGAGGKFLLCVLYISLVSNNILNTYSLALSSQVWGYFFTRVPRYILAFVSAMVAFVLAMVGRDKLSTILGNFLPMIAYWSAIYFMVLIEENLIFRRDNLPGLNDSYDWSIWNDHKKMPACLAATAAACCGVVGAAMGMCQVYYVGPVAKLIGDEYHADVGLFLTWSFTGVTYPVLRYLEIRYRKAKGLRV